MHEYITLHLLACVFAPARGLIIVMNKCVMQYFIGFFHIRITVLSGVFLGGESEDCNLMSGRTLVWVYAASYYAMNTL